MVVVGSGLTKRPKDLEAERGTLDLSNSLKIVCVASWLRLKITLSF